MNFVCGVGGVKVGRESSPASFVSFVQEEAKKGAGAGGCGGMEEFFPPFIGVSVTYSWCSPVSSEHR